MLSFEKWTLQKTRLYSLCIVHYHCAQCTIVLAVQHQCIKKALNSYPVQCLYIDIRVDAIHVVHQPPNKLVKPLYIAEVLTVRQVLVLREHTHAALE